MRNILVSAVLSLSLIMIASPASAGRVDLAQTGQTNCYNAAGTVIDCAGTGQDGEIRTGIRSPAARFTDNEDGTVTDHLTGLMWQQDTNCIATTYPTFDNDGTAEDGAVTWQHALDFANGVNDGTYSNCASKHADWRLPNVNELRSLIDFSQMTPALPAGHPFTITDSNRYCWTSTTVYDPIALNTNWAWVIRLLSGQESSQSKAASLAYVWLVRDSGIDGSIELSQTGLAKCYDETGAERACAGTGEDAEYAKGAEWPEPRYTDNGDGTITDEATGLMWFEKSTDACMVAAVNWEDALAKVADINANPGDYAAGCSYTAEYNDWRLPNARELQSIMQPDFFEQTCVSVCTPIATWLWEAGFWVVGGAYWTSTSSAVGAEFAWHVHTSNVGGLNPTLSKSTDHWVWPVRGGVYGDPDISITPSSAAFGEKDAGTQHDVTFTIKNEGTYYLVLGAIGGANPLAAPFSVVSDDCTNATFAPGRTCTFAVRFAPTVAGDFADSFDVASDDPDEPALTVNVSGRVAVDGAGEDEETDGTGGGVNEPPTAVELVSPTDGASGLDTTVEFRWRRTSDPEGEDVSYSLAYCASEDFSMCAPVEDIASAADIRTLIARATPVGAGAGLLLAGLILPFGRRRSRFLLIALAIFAFGAMSACGGGSGATGADGDTAAAEEMSYTVSGLAPATTYYWKVIAKDDSGNSAESAVRSFTTQ